MRWLALPLALALACAKPYLAARPEAPALPAAPAGVSHDHWTFAGVGGVTLFAQAWRPADAPKAVLIVMHGLRDHGDRYADFAAGLVAAGYAVYAFDLRGHGRSAGRRVTIDSFDDYLGDFDRFVAAVKEREPHHPVFLFGHSMGGAIVTLWAERHPDGTDGIILSAPAIEIDKPPVAAAATIVAGALTPNFGGLTPSNDGFSSDPAGAAAMAADPLIFQPGGPVATATELVGAMEQIWAATDRLTMPLLLLHGTADQQTAPAGSRDLYRRATSTDKSLRIYDGLAHDLLHEPKRAEVAGDVLAWLEAHTGGAATSFAAPDLGRELTGDGGKPAASVALEGAFESSDAQTPARWAGGRTRVRFVLGQRLGLPLGLDAELLGGHGLFYRAIAYPLGLALTDAGGDMVSLGLGAGVSDLGDGAAFELPLAVDGEVQLGPVRALGWARVAWVRGSAARKIDNGLPFGDELRLGLGLRLGADHHYWSTANAGAGPYLAGTLEEVGGAKLLGLALGLHLWGGS